MSLSSLHSATWPWSPSLSSLSRLWHNIPVIYYRSLFLRGPIPFSIPANTSPSKIYDHLGEFGRRRQKICLGRLQWAAGSPRPVRSHLMLSWWPGPASADCSPVPGSHYLSELDTRTEDYSDTRIGWAHSHNCTLSPGATSNLNANFELKQVAGWAPLPPVWPGQLTGWLARFLSGARIFCFINFANGQKMVFKSEWNPHEHSQLSIPAALLSIKW